MVTTRPVAADKLRRLATSRIEIMGFGNEEANMGENEMSASCIVVAV